MLWGIDGAGRMVAHDFGTVAERRGEVVDRRLTPSEQRRLSDARKLEERNAGLGPRHRDRLTLNRAAGEVGLTMSNPMQILVVPPPDSPAAKARADADGVHGAADVVEANPTNVDSDPTPGLRRSGRVGIRAGNRSQELEKLQRENLRCCIDHRSEVFMEKSLQKRRRRLVRLSLGEESQREEIEKANESLGLKLPCENISCRLARETPGTPLPKGGAMLTTGEEMQVKRFVVELRARKFKVRPNMVLNLRRH